MNTTELKKLAEAAAPIETELYGDRYFQGPFSCAILNKEQDAYIAAANPAAILELLEVTNGLAEALKLCLHAVELAGWEGDYSAACARSALAKYEGVQSE